MASPTASLPGLDDVAALEPQARLLRDLRAFAFIQELPAGRAVEAPARYISQHVTVLRGGIRQVIEATGLSPNAPSRAAGHGMRWG